MKSKLLRFSTATMLMLLVAVPFSSFTGSAPADDRNRPIHITDATFDETISKGVVLVDFWAIWCRPCRMMGPVLDSLAVKMEGRAVIGKLDVDHNKQTTRRFGVSSIPTIIIFKDGQAVKRFVGVTSESTLIATLESLLPKPSVVDTEPAEVPSDNEVTETPPAVTTAGPDAATDTVEVQVADPAEPAGAPAESDTGTNERKRGFWKRFSK
jgi:thioredoxin 1